MFDPQNYNMKCPSCLKTYGENPLACPNCLDYLNRLRLLLTPMEYHNESADGLSVNPETLQAAGASTMNFHIRKTEHSLGDHYKLLKMLQGATAACAILYDVRIVKARVPDPSVAEKNTKEFNAIVQRQKESDKPKVAKVAMTAQEKAISKLMSTLKLSRDAAEKIVLGALAGDGQHVAKVWKDPSLQDDSAA